MKVHQTKGIGSLGLVEQLLVEFLFNSLIFQLWFSRFCSFDASFNLSVEQVADYQDYCNCLRHIFPSSYTIFIPPNLCKVDLFLQKFLLFYIKNIPRSARGITKLYTIVAMLYHRNRQYSKRQPIKKQMLDRLLPHLLS